MKSKMISIFTAAVITMGVAFVVPVGMTAVSGFTFVSEAQAFGVKSLKKSAKKVGRKAKKGGKAVARSKAGKAIGREAKFLSKIYPRKASGLLEPWPRTPAET